MIKLWKVLKKLGLLSPLALFRLSLAIAKQGINVMALLDFSAREYGEKQAIVDDDETISFQQLKNQSEKLAKQLKEYYQLKPGDKVGLLCKNHGSFVRAIFACSRLGVDVYFLNTEMSKEQTSSQIKRHPFQLVILDQEWETKLQGSTGIPRKLFSYHESLQSIDQLVTEPCDKNVQIPRTQSGKLMLLTGGTTGKPKEAAHKPSLFQYLDPFLDLLNRLQLTQYATAYIATPIYHGFGLAVLFLFIALGKRIVITKKFEAKRACHLMETYQVEVVTAVPLMVQKLLNENVEKLKSLKCIAAGSAVLQPALIEKVFRQLGPVLYNLYGTSEAGLMVIATPEDLQYSSRTVGRKIEGVRLKIVNEHMQEVASGVVGQICLQKGKRNIETGDLGYFDEKGYYYLCGRVDDMIVSGGINVFSNELELVLNHHPEVADVSVIGVEDELFGSRMVAFVQLTKPNSVKKEELMDWTREKVARYQIPKEIIILNHIPYTPVGKPDKKRLLEDYLMKKYRE